MSLRKKTGILLWPVSLIYGTITAIRNRMFNCGLLKETSFKTPVISVGNITVGGTGKTPHVEYIIDLLHKDFHIAVLSRGYKRKTKGYILASAGSGIADIGDEPKQIRQKYPDIKVAVSEKRVEGIQKLTETIPSPDAIILDDAFQHRYVKPGLSILLIDYNRPLASDHLLPYGDLRENKHETRRANLIVITKTPVNINPLEKTIFKKGLRIYPFQQVYFSSLVYGEPESVFSKNRNRIKNEQIATGYHVLLVTGIANPEPLHQHLLRLTGHVEKHYFPDHYKFSEKDLEKILSRYKNIPAPKKIILTTEKDAIRLREIKPPKEFMNSVYFIPVKVKFLENQEKFNKTIIDYILKEKRK